MSPAPETSPALSVVLPAPEGFASVADVLEPLRAQSARSRLELVLVVPDARLAPPATATAGFAACRSVASRFASRAEANAAGVRAARAPIVAIAEDHSFPEPGWAAALLRRHTGPWAAVGPVVRNANPRTRVSRCDVVLNYGPWLEPVAGGEVTSLPGHNTSYKRATLMRYEPRLAFWLETETLLHEALRRHGERLYLEPEARVAHVNVSRLGAWLPALALGGRAYAGARAERWSRARRLVYGLGAPLISLVRLAQVIRAWRGPRAQLAACLPVLALGLAADALGQGIGFVRGAGDAATRLARFEFGRAADVTAGDRQTLFPARARAAA